MPRGRYRIAVGRRQEAHVQIDVTVILPAATDHRRDAVTNPSRAGPTFRLRNLWRSVENLEQMTMPRRVRSIFLSDIHLGTPACQAERLLDFLRGYDCEYLFLVGDIVDFWHIRRRGVTWTTAQNTVVQKVLKRARHDVQVVFVPGNHDEAVREHAGTLFGNIRVERDHVHEAADGRRYLLIHGD